MDSKVPQPMLESTANFDDMREKHCGAYYSDQPCSPLVDITSVSNVQPVQAQTPADTRSQINTGSSKHQIELYKKHMKHI